MLLTSAVTLTTAVLAPVVALATVVLLPFTDRLTQAYMLLVWATYLGLFGVILG